MAYLQLPGHPGAGISNAVGKQISLSDLVENYVGPDIILDFAPSGELIGVEILA